LEELRLREAGFAALGDDVEGAGADFVDVVGDTLHDKIS
jgi:hypothetical protein